MPNRTLLTLCAAFILVVAATLPLRAHEIGTTLVTATFTGDEYAIDVETDAASLLARLEAAAGRPRSGTLTAAEYVARITDLRDTLLAHLHVTLGATDVVPTLDSVREIAGTPPAADAIEWSFAPPQVALRLRGPLPAGARTFAWRYELTAASYGLVVKINGRTGATEWLDGGEPSRTVALDAPASAVSRLALARTYFTLGFTHIVPYGLDHVLFVLGVFLLSRRVRPMLWQVSAFTVAHSITLGLTLYGVVPESPSIVEPLIALSIVYVAVENLTTSEVRPWRIALVFAFGLLHGMGFAGALKDLGLPRSEFITGLLTFNAGVEAGQLTIIAAAFVLLAYWSRNRIAYRRFIVVPGSLAIAMVGMYWTVERLPW